LNTLVNFRCADPRFAGQFSASGNTNAVINDVGFTRNRGGGKG
jgi:hypothetical protein